MLHVDVVGFKKLVRGQCRGLLDIKYHGMMMTCRVIQYKDSHMFFEMPALRIGKKYVKVCWWADRTSSDHFQKLLTMLVMEKFPEALEIIIEDDKKVVQQN